MKRVLITGASGFIGNFVVKEAVKQNYEVYAGVRKSSNRSFLESQPVKIVELDFSDKKKLTKQLLHFSRFHYIVHVAGIIKTCDPADFDKVNYEYVKNFIEVLHENDVIPDNFIFISSLAAVGPGDENTFQPVKINDTPHPVTKYGKSKLKAEKYIRSLKDFPFVILRSTGVYGPGEKDYYMAYKSISQHIETYIGSKEQHLTFIYVTDLARLIFLILKSEITGKTYFATDLKFYTAEQFNTIIKKVLKKNTLVIVFPKKFVRFVTIISEWLSCLFGKPTTLNSDKYKELICKNWLCEADELKRDFDFVPFYDLEKGVKEAITWYKSENLL